MEEKHAKMSSLQIWLLAARPKTLPAAASVAVVGSAAAFSEGKFQLLPALAAVFGALLLQIGANLANDVFDFYKGADAHGRMGPPRVTQEGLLTPEQVKRGMWVTFGLAAGLGLYLYSVSGWPVLCIGLSSILAALAYTGGPLPFGYYGLGDVMAFIFFGPVAVCGTYYVQAGEVSRVAALASLPMGFLITAILVVNNLRDIETDRRAGKMTLAVRLGERGTQIEYLFCLAAAYALAPIIWLIGPATAWLWVTWLSIPMAASVFRFIRNEKGRALNHALAGTGQLTLLYGVLVSVGLILPRLFSLL
jgi:1,4-dihydroxy-2-naphthoate octaprenyltransferase